MPTLEEFLSPGPLNGQFGTSKKINDLLHKKNSNRSYTCSHVEHQDRVIAQIDGMEMALFHAPYEYMYRSWGGNTGRMNAVLTSCFFKLFRYLMERRVPIDRNYTIGFLFTLFFFMDFSADGTKIKMPTDELNDLKAILIHLRRSDPSGIFTEEWWGTFKTTLDEKIRSASSTPFFQTPGQTPAQKWEFVRTRGKPLPYLSDIEEYSPWEYHPCYVSNQPTMTMDNLDTKIETIKCMFLTPERCQNEDIRCRESSCVGRGGKRKRRSLRSKIEKRKTRKRRQYNNVA